MGLFPLLLQNHVHSHVNNSEWCSILDHFRTQLKNSFYRRLRLVQGIVDLEITLFCGAVLWCEGISASIGHWSQCCGIVQGVPM